MKWNIPLFKIYWGEEDIEAVNKVMRRGTYWADGPDIVEFESKLSNYFNRKYAVTFNSGTSALHASLLSHDITNGEVIVPSFTFISTANSVIVAGARPVFAEIEEKTYGLNPEDVNERITPKTKAIIPVHYAGGVCGGIKALREICEDHKILLIEDSAESLGASMDGVKAGTFGDSAMFSFCQNKVITIGEGGVIITDSEKAYKKLRLIRSHGRVDNEQDYFSTIGDMDYVQIGYNYRLPTILAALGISQLSRVDEIINKRLKVAEYYNNKLSLVKGIKTPVKNKNVIHVHQLYTTEVENGELRDRLMKYLSENGIMSKVYFKPTHLKTFYRQKYGYKKGDLPKTEDISNHVLSLPMYPTLKNEEIDYITKKICRFMEDELF